MKNEQKNTNVELTKELYMSMSSDITGQIAEKKQAKEDILATIKGRLEYLKELRAEILKRRQQIKKIKLQIKDIKIKISDEKRLLSGDKREKFALTRELVSKKNNSKKLNTLYVNGETTIDISKFSSTKEQKAR